MSDVAEDLGFLGYELLTPIPGGRRAATSLQQWAADSPLVAVGGSDAHHLEDLYQVVVHFPGHSLAEFQTALQAGTVRPEWGSGGPRVPIPRQLRQHTRALVGQPSRQLGAWAGRVLRPPRGG
jgi:hypothetical protein